LKGRPVLTVSDAVGFAKRGGMIRFVTDRSRIRLRINLEATRDAHLTLSSKLLRPAQIVRTGED
jgi:YfiR/HmsC-like